MWCNTLKCNVVVCSVVQCCVSVVNCGAVWCSLVQGGAVLYFVVHFGTGECILL